MSCATGQSSARLSIYFSACYPSVRISRAHRRGRRNKRAEKWEAHRCCAAARREESRVTKNMRGRANPTLDWPPRQLILVAGSTTTSVITNREFMTAGRWRGLERTQPPKDGEASGARLVAGSTCRGGQVTGPRRRVAVAVASRARVIKTGVAVPVPRRLGKSGVGRKRRSRMDRGEAGAGTDGGTCDADVLPARPLMKVKNERNSTHSVAAAGAGGPKISWPPPRPDRIGFWVGTASWIHSPAPFCSRQLRPVRLSSLTLLSTTRAC